MYRKEYETFVTLQGWGKTNSIKDHQTSNTSNAKQQTFKLQTCNP